MQMNCIAFISAKRCVGHCQRSMARLRVADGGNGLQIWRGAENITNNQSRTADKGLTSSFAVGRGLTTSRRKKKSLLRNVAQGLGLGGYLNMVMNLRIP